jgi:hypothetical protein
MTGETASFPLFTATVSHRQKKKKTLTGKHDLTRKSQSLGGGVLSYDPNSVS